MNGDEGGEWGWGRGRGERSISKIKKLRDQYIMHNCFDTDCSHVIQMM